MEARRDWPGCFNANACRSRVKPSHAAMTNSKGFLETTVNGCVSAMRIPGIQTKQCEPGLADLGDRRSTIRVPPHWRGVMVAVLPNARKETLRSRNVRSDIQIHAAKMVMMRVFCEIFGRCIPMTMSISMNITTWTM